MRKQPAWAEGARCGPVRRHRKIAFFACEGLVVIFDERVPEREDYIVVTPADFYNRAVGLNSMGKRMVKEQLPFMRAEGQQIVKAAANMVETIKEAKAMGDPSDPAVREYWARHRRSNCVSFSPRSDPEGYPKLPDLPLGKFTGRTAEAGIPLDGGGVPFKIRQKPRMRSKLLLS